MRRITADLDTLDLKKIDKYIAKAIKFIPKIQQLNLIKSSSKGYHLIIFTKSTFTKKDIFLFRELIGDDINRIRLDKIRKQGMQTLFDRKEKINNNDLFGVTKP